MTQENPSPVDARLEEIARQMAVLQKEADELTTWKRVNERFANGGATASATSSSKGKPRPNGIPNNFEMVEAVLATAGEGLTAAELVKAIEARFWPGLVGDQILPSIYQFAKKKRLKKNLSGKFKRVEKTNEAASV
jgi:hypothetical protein